MLRPKLPFDDVVGGCWRNPDYFSDLGSSHSAFSHVSDSGNGFPCQNRYGAQFPRSSSVGFFYGLNNSKVSVLLHHVLGVIFRCSKKQVEQINTIWIVALMKNALHVGNWANYQYPDSPSSINILSNVPNYAPIITTSSPQPFPARSKIWNMLRNWAIFIHPFPESLRQRYGKTLFFQVLLGRFELHSISSVDCLPRLRLFLQRGATLLHNIRSIPVVNS